ncbi:hypothetical protein PPNSA23_47000 [Phyllobacterium phragmitis]|uniref:Uncharacterized protein n=1 Tax=Phyllobacterium phragmitis TaxID=2670329 RepID=A0ABQ0H754_9HYPH
MRVHVSAYPERNPGDRITLTMARQEPYLELTRYAYLQDPGQDQDTKIYEVRVEPLWALLSGQYEVFYMITSRTGNASASAPKSVSITDTPEQPPSAPVSAIQVNLFGTYLPGLVGSWMVPEDYTFTPNNGLLAQSLASYSVEQASTPNTILSFYKNEEMDPFAQLASDGSGTNWTTKNQAETDFARGDLISIKLDGTDNAKLFLAVAL